MNRKILILKPRLDLPFKKFGIEIANPNLPEIRTHWEKFVDNLRDYHKVVGDTVHVVESQRWQFHNSLVDMYSPDIAYVPHVERHNFKGGNNCRYYMQTVIPWLFTIDELGWGGGASFVGADYEVADDNGKTYEYYRQRALRGESKYKQPINDNSFFCGDDFIFCPLQIPHDETIKWHSKVKMEELVEKLVHWSQRSGVQVVFKPHPINPASMEEMRKIVNGKCIWVDNVNIHNVIEKSSAVYIVNSGTGMESMLFGIPVVRFGDAEYNDAVIKGNINDLDETWKKVKKSDVNNLTEKYKKFYNWFCNRICYDVNDMQTFMKLK